MNNPTSDSNESSATAASTAGESSTSTDSASHTASSVTMTPEQVQQLIQASTAPILEKLAALENTGQARKRIAAKAQKTASDESKEPENMSKEEQLLRQVEALTKANEEREAQEKRQRGKTALADLVSPEKYANADILKKLIEPNIVEGAGGILFHDDGEKATPLDQYVREIGSQPVFQLPADGASTGTNTNPTVASVGGKAITSEAMKNMSREEFAKLKAAKKAGKTNF